MRYTDDIFLLWHLGEEKLKEFLDILNRYHPSIKFTSKYSRKRIDFLDVEIIKEGNRLITDVFVKSTDTHQYLHATSCHVYHSKKSIPYSQALRFNRICSENQFFDKRCNDLEVWLKNVVKMRSWWDNKSWRLGNIGEQNFCIVREKKFIKISWCLILLIIQFFRNLRIFYLKFIFFQHRRGNTEKFLRMFHPGEGQSTST